MESIRFTQNNVINREKKNDSWPDMHCTAILFQGLCQFRRFLSHKHYFSFLLLLSYLYPVYPKSFLMPSLS